MKAIDQQTVFITGSTDGIGKLTALTFARQRAHVLVHGRNQEKLKGVIGELRKQTNNKNIDGFLADLSSLEEVRRLAGEVIRKNDSIDILINNAGVGYADPRYSKDGYELRFAVNYLAPFLLTNLLLPALKKAAPSRIVNVSSAGQFPVDFGDIMLEKNFNSGTAYAQSKLALIMFTIDLAEELKNDNITANSLHPGTYLDTNMVRHAGIKPWGKVEAGAESVVYVATSPELENITGKYFNIKREEQAAAQAYDANARERLRNLSLKLTAMVST